LRTSFESIYGSRAITSPTNHSWNLAFRGHLDVGMESEREVYLENFPFFSLFVFLSDGDVALALNLSDREMNDIIRRAANAGEKAKQ
jgi:hypothetical protein